MNAVGIDPGNMESAYCHVRFTVDGRQYLVGCGKAANSAIFPLVRSLDPDEIQIFAVEKVVSFGRVVGAEVMDTAMVAGALGASFGGDEALLIPRAKVRFHLGGTKKAGDKEVRAALIAWWPFLESRLSSDMWSAMAVLKTAYDLKMKGGIEKYVRKFH